jgi:adenylate cyclase
MSDSRNKRRLSAILAADVVGYTRRMEQDTDGTVAAWNSARSDIIDPTISNHSGRIVKHTGDGFLVEFQTVQDAVMCAVAMQDELSASSLDFRMGISLGDIIDDGEDIHGEGVNIAARIEALAEAGGIYISGDVYNQVRNRVDQHFEDIGEHEVKHVSEPVRVYRIGVGGVEPIVMGTTDFDLPDKPSITVLPFDNMSGNPEQEYFADGIADDLTTALSRFDWLFVIARNSAFTYKGKAVDVKQVGRELGVRYVLEGSVQRAGDRVRINAQLVDADVDRHVWAERYDRQMVDVFELQNDIVASIAATVAPEITLAEIERARSRLPKTLDAWDRYLQAVASYHRMTEGDIETAISLLEQAIDLEPEFASAYALLSRCHAEIGQRGWIQPVRGAYELSRRIAEKAVRVAPSSPEANQALAFVLIMIGEAERAVTVARRAIDLNPNYAEGQTVLGLALVFNGDLEGSLAACHRAQRSNPRDTRGNWLCDAMGHAYFMLGDYEEAIDVSKKGLSEDPSMYGALVTLACSYAQLGRNEEARQYVDELRRLIPRYTLRALRKNPFFVKPDLIEKLVESMRLAGLPE